VCLNVSVNAKYSVSLVSHFNILYIVVNLKWIKTFQSYTWILNNTRSCLSTTLMDIFDPLQILTTVYKNLTLKGDLLWQNRTLISWLSLDLKFAHEAWYYGNPSFRINLFENPPLKKDPCLGSSLVQKWFAVIDSVLIDSDGGCL